MDRSRNPLIVGKHSDVVPVSAHEKIILDVPDNKVPRSDRVYIKAAKANNGFATKLRKRDKCYIARARVYSQFNAITHLQAESQAR